MLVSKTPELLEDLSSWIQNRIYFLRVQVKLYKDQMHYLSIKFRKKKSDITNYLFTSVFLKNMKTSTLLFSYKMSLLVISHFYGIHSWLCIFPLRERKLQYCSRQFEKHKEWQISKEIVKADISEIWPTKI